MHVAAPFGLRRMVFQLTPEACCEGLHPLRATRILEQLQGV
jgi:hypothetical protein